MAPAHRDILLYIVKCVTGCALLLTVRNYYPETDISWVLISMLLVLSPDKKEVIPLTTIRVKANLIGSFAGLLFLFLTDNIAVALCLAISVTILCCYWLNLMVGVRSAMAAVIIILLHPQGAHLWSTAYERVIMVVAGCALGLLLTVIFHRQLWPRASTHASTSKDGE